MIDRRRRPLGGVAQAVLLSAALMTSLLTASPAAADDPDGNPTIADLVVEETSGVSPLTPGVRDSRSFETGTWLPYGENFARVKSDGLRTLVIEVLDRAGTVTVEELEVDEDLVASYSGVAINDDYVLIREDGFLAGLVSVGRVDRRTGGILNLGAHAAGLDGLGMSGDGTIVVGSDQGEPYWLRATSTPEIEGNFEVRAFVDGDDGNSNGDITYLSDRPIVDVDGKVAVLIGHVVNSGIERTALIIDTIDPEGSSDQIIGLPCDVATCEYELGGVDVDGFFVNIYVGVFGLEAGPGSDRVSAQYIRRSTNEVASAPVAAISPNGRYLVGNSQVGDGPIPTKTKVVVFDTETGRRRTVSIGGLLQGQTVTPVAISDDGLFVQYRAAVPCPAICLITPRFMGWYELEPTAPVTTGPAADQIQRLYRAVFGRIPDEGGFEFWMGRYRNGGSLTGIATAFAASPEFAQRFGADPTDEALIEALYFNVLDRSGDVGGVAFWLDQRADGVTIPALLIAFAESPENIERTATRAPITVSEGRVLRLYSAVFGREPDAGGLAFWVGEYNSGQTSEQVAAGMMESPEFAIRFGDEPNGFDVINILYLNVLGRFGDQGGITFWRGQLDNGLTLPQLLVAFSDSDENVLKTGTVR